jgi:SAM-dependent methyltransferase
VPDLPDPERALSFGPAAADYERGRPGYSAGQVNWLLDGVSGTVLDLGAGTGKLTRAIAAGGWPTIAVVPDPQMLAFNTVGPVVVGTAEAIPLPDAAVAAVTVGQAWHWFHHDRAGAEVARVLHPGGRLALAWHDLDDADPFVADLHRIIEPVRAASDEPPAPIAGFAPFEGRLDRWSSPLTPAELEAYVASRSGFLVAPTEEKRDILTAVDELLRSHPHTRDRSEVMLSRLTWCYRTDRLA